MSWQIADRVLRMEVARLHDVGRLRKRTPILQNLYRKETPKRYPLTCLWRATDCPKNGPIRKIMTRLSQIYESSDGQLSITPPKFTPKSRCSQRILANTVAKWTDVTRDWRNSGKRFHQSSIPKILLPSFLLMATAINNEERDLNESALSQNDNQDIAQLMAKGKNMLHTKCSFDKVESVYTEALHLALSRKDKNAIAYVQDQLANLFLRKGDLEKAEQLFRNVIRNLLDSGIQENDPSIIEISLKLATIYASSKNDEFATSGYEWVIEKCRKNLDDSKKNNSKTDILKNEYENHLALLGMALDSYGRYLYVAGKLNKALDVTRQAVKISTELFGENDMRTQVLYNDIGAILTQSGNYDEAVKIILKSIEIASEEKNLDHGDVAIFWINLSSIYMKQGKSDEAENAFQNAKKEARLSKNKFLLSKIENLVNEMADSTK